MNRVRLHFGCTFNFNLSFLNPAERMEWNDLPEMPILSFFVRNYTENQIIKIREQCISLRFGTFP